MPTKLNLTNLKQSVNQSISDVLRDNEDAQKVLVSLKQFSTNSRQIIKKFLPVIITILVLTIGLAVGKRIASLSDNKINIPKPANLPTTTTLPSDSSLIPLRQSVRQFSAQLPDPLMPEFNDSILLQELED